MLFSRAQKEFQSVFKDVVTSHYYFPDGIKFNSIKEFKKHNTQSKVVEINPENNISAILQSIELNSGSKG